jgi:Icc-related predicted phosphoesterase
MAVKKDTVRIGAVGDIHVSRNSQGALQPLFTEISQKVDVLVLCGDLTDYGLEEEAHVLVKELSVVRIPVLAVLGNHDYEAGRAKEVTDILSEAGVLMLDGDAHEVCGVGFAGTKGFAGGFGRGTLAPWGEPVVKLFVQEAIEEALKLERAVARLRTSERIVVLHYAPIQATVEGEPAEIFPFLGSSRLEEPLARYSVTAVFHGHAHRGTFQGKTMSGTPVYNVSMPLLRQQFPDQPPVFILEVPGEGGET